MRTMSDGEQTISPPARSVSTSDSPSRRCDLIDIVRPFSKYTSSARTGCAPSTTAATATKLTTLMRIHEGMEHSDTELPRILIIAYVELCRNERLVDDQVELD